MYVDPIKRQIYHYATPIPGGNNPRNIIELNPDAGDQDFYFICEPIKRKPLVCLLLLEQKILNAQRTHLQLAYKMLAYILMQNTINFETKYFFQNILIQHFI